MRQVYMNRNTWGNVMVSMFALFVFALSAQYERFHQSSPGDATVPAIAVVSSALLDTLLIVGGSVCAMLIGLHFVSHRTFLRKHSGSKRGD